MWFSPNDFAYLFNVVFVSLLLLCVSVAAVLVMDCHFMYAQLMKIMTDFWVSDSGGWKTPMLMVDPHSDYWTYLAHLSGAQL